jgi:hypothetical protein
MGSANFAIDHKSMIYISDLCRALQVSFVAWGRAKGSGADVINVTPVLRNRPFSEITVNSSDSHPNAQVHAEAAEVIFQRLSKDGLQRWSDASKQ